MCWLQNVKTKQEVEETASQKEIAIREKGKDKKRKQE